jgi:hypothetical protein
MAPHYHDVSLKNCIQLLLISTSCGFAMANAGSYRAPYRICQVRVPLPRKKVTLCDQNLSHIHSQPLEHHVVCAHHCVRNAWRQHDKDSVMGMSCRTARDCIISGSNQRRMRDMPSFTERRCSVAGPILVERMIEKTVV